MMLKIETTYDRAGTVLRLIGRIDVESVAAVQSHISGGRAGVALDLEEVTLVDIDAVHFLLECESHGIAVRHCLPYIRAWMDREMHHD